MVPQRSTLPSKYVTNLSFPPKCYSLEDMGRVGFAAHLIVEAAELGGISRISKQGSPVVNVGRQLLLRVERSSSWDAVVATENHGVFTVCYHRHVPLRGGWRGEEGCQLP